MEEKNKKRIKKITISAVVICFVMLIINFKENLSNPILILLIFGMAIIWIIVDFLVVKGVSKFKRENYEKK